MVMGMVKAKMREEPPPAIGRQLIMTGFNKPETRRTANRKIFLEEKKVLGFMGIIVQCLELNLNRATTIFLAFLPCFFG